MFFTFCVLKFERSKAVKRLQSRNIWLMYSTFCVLKFERSKVVKR